MGSQSPTNTPVTTASAYASPIIVNGVEPEMTRGLKFCLYMPETGTFKSFGADKLLLYTDPGFRALKLNGQNIGIVIPGLKKGQTVTVSCRSVTSSGIRYLNAYNLTADQEFGSAAATNKNEQICIGTVEADGDVVITASNGIFVYDIMVKDATGKLIAAAVHNVQTRLPADGRIYNLNGQYMGRNPAVLQPGVYIRNGKKLMVGARK